MIRLLQWPRVRMIGTWQTGLKQGLKILYRVIWTNDQKDLMTQLFQWPPESESWSSFAGTGSQNLILSHLNKLTSKTWMTRLFQWPRVRRVGYLADLLETGFKFPYIESFEQISLQRLEWIDYCSDPESEGWGTWQTCWKRGLKMRHNIVTSNFQVSHFPSSFNIALFPFPS